MIRRILHIVVSPYSSRAAWARSILMLLIVVPIGHWIGWWAILYVAAVGILLAEGYDDR
jgi:hypothetical protein